MKKSVFMSGPPKHRLAGTSGVLMMPIRGAVGREYPGAAGAGAIDPALDIDLHAVRHADLLVRRHVGEDAPPHDIAGAVELDRVDIHREPGIRDVQGPLVGREGEPVRVFDIGDVADRAVRLDPVDRRRVELALAERYPQPGIGEIDAAVGARRSTSLGRVSRLPSKRSTSTSDEAKRPSAGQRVRRRLPPSQMTSRPCGSKVVPLPSPVFSRSSSASPPGRSR